MKSQFLKAVLAALLTMNEVAFSLPVENNEVRRREGGDESADSRDPSTAYYFRQNGRVTFDHGRVHYVDAVRSLTLLPSLLFLSSSREGLSFERIANIFIRMKTVESSDRVRC